jgi:cytochrome c553
MADAAAGRELARSGAVCHGANSIGTAPNIPKLAGQSEFYLIKQLQDFRAGRRENEQMRIIAETLTDDEICSLAAWYASIPFAVELPANEIAAEALIQSAFYMITAIDPCACTCERRSFSNSQRPDQALLNQWQTSGPSDMSRWAQGDAAQSTARPSIAICDILCAS